jgi:hypothetical protein
VARLFEKARIAFRRTATAIFPVPGRAFRETSRTKSLRQPSSRQASLVSPGGAPKPLLSPRCERRRRSAASRSAIPTPREAPLVERE